MTGYSVGDEGRRGACKVVSRVYVSVVVSLIRRWVKL